MTLLDAIPYSLLVPLAVALAVAPLAPMPHLVEKLIMLKEGTLSRPLDIFDLVMHAAPLLLLAAKLARDWAGRG
ncbi:MAG: hypothetical protein HY804_09435 [Nitrospinae bacterium]|nr:hypothetical protein [Nitrospinota bacterium]